MNDNEMMVSLNLGTACNFRCKYCFEVKSGLVNNPLKVSDKVVKRTVELIRILSQHKLVKLEFWGGEPLMYIDIIVYMMHMLQDCDVYFFIYTNGTLIHKYKELLSMYKEKIYFQVSYDFQNIENNMRFELHKDIKDTDQSVLDAIKYLDNNDFNFAIKSTATIKDLEENIYDQYMNFLNITKDLKGYHKFALTPDTLNTTLPDFDKVHTQFIKLLTYFKKHLDEPTRFAWFDGMANADCHGGDNNFIVNYDGNVTYCHGCLYLPNNNGYVNIFDDNVLYKIEHNYLREHNMFEKPPQCKACDSIFCFRCNAVNSRGDETKWNLPNHPNTCKIYNKISQYIKVYKSLLYAYQHDSEKNNNDKK